MRIPGTYVRLTQTSTHAGGRISVAVPKRFRAAANASTVGVVDPAQVSGGYNEWVSTGEQNAPTPAPPILREDADLNVTWNAR
jgi:hypothetical protein